MVRAAAASSSVPISSMMMDFRGVIFHGLNHPPRLLVWDVKPAMRRARPIAGWGTSPSPAISFEVSITITRLLSSSASTLAISRSLVVLPTPGGPRKSIDLPDSTRSLMMLIVPEIARPTRQVRPIILPERLRDGPRYRCRVRSIPARLSPENSPTRSIANCRSCSVMWLLGTGTASGCHVAGLRLAPQIENDFPLSRLVSLSSTERKLSGRIERKEVRSSAGGMNSMLYLRVYSTTTLIFWTLANSRISSGTRCPAMTSGVPGGQGGNGLGGGPSDALVHRQNLRGQHKSLAGRRFELLWWALLRAHINRGLRSTAVRRRPAAANAAVRLSMSC